MLIETIEPHSTNEGKNKYNITITKFFEEIAQNSYIKANFSAVICLFQS